MEGNNDKSINTRPDMTINSKKSITCTNVPEALFDATAAKKHFTKFGRVQRIRLIPKRRMCIVEYDQPTSASCAVLNAGAYDGFMFEVARYKSRIRKKSKAEDDPDWVPDSDVEEELSAMSGVPNYRVTRQNAMQVDTPPIKSSTPVTKKATVSKQIVVRKKTVEKRAPNASHIKSGIESPVIVSSAMTCMSTAEAAAELHQLKSKVSVTPDEQWRTLDARDRILRLWGGTGARARAGGATAGTCRDMCPEKERLHRLAEHQLTQVEAEWGVAVKQYSRSSADQEAPMCYELRPPRALALTMSYLLHRVADSHQMTLGDWFHFMWDRLRSIRKDIAQQALCCAESIRLVECCARFHAHCAARLAGLEHAHFDPKLNTDNLTKCLQSLKQMYGEAAPRLRPREPEFRGYVALLNLGDANFWWEIKQLPLEIQKSKEIVFAIKIFNALDNNNYVKFFRLVREEATYLQACILLRYFNDVRARALARIVKAYAPRGGSRYPAEDLMKSLAFESLENMKSFINHYGLRIGKTLDPEISIILDRNQFIEDSEPYQNSRSVKLIESKRKCKVGEVIAGGSLPENLFEKYIPHCSFDCNGILRNDAVIAADQGYNTSNDSNQDISNLKEELQILSGKSSNIDKHPIIPQLESKVKKKSDAVKNIFIKPKQNNSLYIFKPAILLDINPSQKVLNVSREFNFSKPHLLFDAQEFSDLNKCIIPNHIQPHTHNASNHMGSISNSIPELINLNAIKNEFRQSSQKAGEIHSSNVFKQSMLSQNTLNENDEISSKPKPQDIYKHSNEISLFGFNNNKNKNISPSTLFKNAISKTNGDVESYADERIADSMSTNCMKFSGNVVTSNNKNNVFGVTTSNTLFGIQPNIIDNKSSIFHKKDTSNYINTKSFELNNKEANKKTIEEEKAELERIISEKAETERKAFEKAELEKKAEREKLRQAEIEKKEQEERFINKVNEESTLLVEEIIEEVSDETVKECMNKEIKVIEDIDNMARDLLETILLELCEESCKIDIEVETYRTNKLMEKWFRIWKSNYKRNHKRRNILNDTPVWLATNSCIGEATSLRREAESLVLLNIRNMNKRLVMTPTISKPHTFSKPQPFNVMEIIKSSLLKRMKEINHSYKKCLFWKITLVSPSEGMSKYMYKKIDVSKWLLEVFSDKEPHNSRSLIHVQKQSWNNLVDFAIAVSLNSNDRFDNTEMVEGTNGIIFYFTESFHFREVILKILQLKYPYQRLPVAVIISEIDENTLNTLKSFLTELINLEYISAFKIFLVKAESLNHSLNNQTKIALKWLARNYPAHPPLETDKLKSICYRYLGFELWDKLKEFQDEGTAAILKDLSKLISIYNTSIDRLSKIIADERILNYPPFPLEFTVYLSESFDYPKSYEFISVNSRSTQNFADIKNAMNSLKLPYMNKRIESLEANAVNQQIQTYCSETNVDYEDVFNKSLSVLVDDDSSDNFPDERHNKYFACCDLLKFMHSIVKEKIDNLDVCDDLLAIYETTELKNYVESPWWYESEILPNMKHKMSDYCDDVDMFIKAKRRKIEMDSMEYLTLEDKDCTLVEETIKNTDENIAKYDKCEEVLNELEIKIEKERNKSYAFENLLKAALSDV